MQTSAEGFQQAYNAQVAVDDQARLIVAVDVGPNPADHGRLEEMLEMVAENLGALPERVLADAGYAYRADPWPILEQRGVAAYVSLGREGRRAPVQLSPARGRMAAKLRDRGRQVDLRRPQERRRTPVRLDKARYGLGALQRKRLKPRCRGEWALVCLARNARRLNVVAGA